MLAVGVVSEMPDSLALLCRGFVGKGAVTGNALTKLVVTTIVLLMMILMLVLGKTREEVPIRCSGGVIKEGLVNNRSAGVPLGIGATNIVPMVFTSSVVSFPTIVTRLAKGNGNAKVKDRVVHNLSSGG